MTSFRNSPINMLTDTPIIKPFRTPIIEDMFNGDFQSNHRTFGQATGLGFLSDVSTSAFSSLESISFIQEHAEELILVQSPSTLYCQLRLNDICVFDSSSALMADSHAGVKMLPRFGEYDSTSSTRIPPFHGKGSADASTHDRDWLMESPPLSDKSQNVFGRPATGPIVDINMCQMAVKDQEPGACVNPADIMGGYSLQEQQDEPLDTDSDENESVRSLPCPNRPVPQRVSHPEVKQESDDQVGLSTSHEAESRAAQEDDTPHVEMADLSPAPLDIEIWRILVAAAAEDSRVKQEEQEAPPSPMDVCADTKNKGSAGHTTHDHGSFAGHAPQSLHSHGPQSNVPFVPKMLPLPSQPLQDFNPGLCPSFHLSMPPMDGCLNLPGALAYPPPLVHRPLHYDMHDASKAGALRSPLTDLNQVPTSPLIPDTPICNAHLGVGIELLRAKMEKFKIRNPGKAIDNSWFFPFVGKLSPNGHLLDDYRCYIIGCNQKNKRRDHIVTHIGSHVDHRPFQCAFCGLRFLRRNECKRHEVRHADEVQTFMCELCPPEERKSYSRQDTLRRHLNRAHGVPLSGKENGPRKRGRAEMEGVGYYRF